jgi:hypothetical protein
MPLADKRILVSGYNVLTARSMLSDMRFHLRLVGTTPSGQSAVLTANFYPQARDLLGFRRDEDEVFHIVANLLDVDFPSWYSVLRSEKSVEVFCLEDLGTRSIHEISLLTRVDEKPGGGGRLTPSTCEFPGRVL